MNIANEKTVLKVIEESNFTAVIRSRISGIYSYDFYSKDNTVLANFRSSLYYEEFLQLLSNYFKPLFDTTMLNKITDPRIVIIICIYIVKE